jgi:hypothetical protein
LGLGRALGLLLGGAYADQALGVDHVGDRSV